MAEHSDVLKQTIVKDQHNIIIGSEIEKKTQSENDPEGLSNVDLSQTRYTFAKDFCIKMASVFVDEYTPIETIQNLLKIMAKTDNKRTILSTTFQVFTEVYKNYLLKHQIGKAFKTYKETRLNADEPRSLEACMKAFARVSVLEIGETIPQEFVSIFDKMDDAIILKLERRFNHGEFIQTVLYSGALIRGNTELICDPRDEVKTQKIVGLVQYMMHCIDDIKRALKNIMDKKGLKLIMVSKQIKKNNAQFVDKSEIDDFFQSYVLEIIEDQLQLEKKQAQASKSSGKDDNKNRTLSLQKSSLKESEDWLSLQISIPQLIENIINIKDHTLPNEVPELPKEALSIVAHLEKTSDLSHFMPPEDTLEKMVIRSIRMQDARRKVHCKACRKSDEIAAMLDRFPLVEAMNDARAIIESILKFMRLYPGTVNTVGPYLIIIEGTALLIGSMTATEGVIHPKKNRVSVRCWKSITNGVVLLVFSLGASINIYLDVHPDQKNISNTTFYRDIALLPFFLMSFHTIWYSFSPLQKELWLPKGTKSYYLRKFIDFSSKSLYNAGVFLFAGITFFSLPKTMLYQLLPLIPGALVSLGQTFSSYKEPLNTLMTYITFGIFSAMLEKEEFSQHSGQFFEGQPQMIARGIMLGGLTIYSLGLLIKYNVSFLRDYINEEDRAEILVQRIKIPRKNNRSLTDAKQSKVPEIGLLGMEEYHLLEESINTKNQILEVEAAKPLIFSGRNQSASHSSISSTKRNDSKEDALSQSKSLENNEKEPRSSRCGKCVIL